MTTIAELPPGFADKVLSAQSTFRSVMDAMARPGSVQRIVPMAGTPGMMMRGTAAIALTLFDHDTPLWLDARLSESSDVTKRLKFHTGPGIDGVATLQASIKPFDLFERLRMNEVLFPRGIDVVLVADDAVVAIPRTIRVVSKGS
jgi:alpha-D-ribose 1-methylphosphonate 5-triphosphate synthase subunit PhnH